MEPVCTIAEGRFLGLYQEGRWEYAARPNASGVVGILARTPEGGFLLVEQFRIPMRRRVIELPAGLVGDDPARPGEPLEEAARRELREETGYRAGRLRHLFSGPTSAGMTSETTHLFLATGLVRESGGGGVDGEEITVHHVPGAGLRAWLAGREAEGILVDFKIHAALWLAGFHDLQ